MSILVTPKHIRTGVCAPSIMSFTSNEDDAIQDAKSKSRLSDFSEWEFKTTKKLKERQSIINILIKKQNDEAI